MTAVMSGSSPDVSPISTGPTTHFPSTGSEGFSNSSTSPDLRAPTNSILKSSHTLKSPTQNMNGAFNAGSILRSAHQERNMSQSSADKDTIVSEIRNSITENSRKRPSAEGI